MTQLQKTVKYLRNSSEKNWETAEYLLKGKHYDACLFFCHLALEKLLKAILTHKTDKPAPYSHDLRKLSGLVGASLSLDYLEQLDVITGFNIAGRYDDEKKKFYKQCTKAYANKYLKVSKEIFLWLKNNYPEK